MYITTTNFTNFTNISMQNDLKTMHRRCNELNEFRLLCAAINSFNSCNSWLKTILRNLNNNIIVASN